MLSMRLNAADIARIRHAAADEGVSVSEFVRRAALSRAALGPEPTLLEQLGGFVGILDSSDPDIVPVESELGAYLSAKLKREAEESRRARAKRAAEAEHAG